MCTFFEPFIIAIHWEGAWSNFRVHSLMGSAQNKSLISDTEGVSYSHRHLSAGIGAAQISIT